MGKILKLDEDYLALLMNLNNQKIEYSELEGNIFEAENLTQKI